MNEKPKNIEQLIDDYHRNLLQVEQRKEVESWVANNPDLKKLFDLSQLEHHAMEVLIEDQLRSDMESWKNGQSQKQSKRKPQVIVSVAASIVLIIACGIWIMHKSNKSQFRTYFVEDPGLPTLMSDAGSTLYYFNTGMVAYKQQKHKKAIEVWESIATEAPSDTLQYYLGMAYLNTGQIEQSEQQLINIPSHSAFYTKGRWYLGLLALKQGQIDQAIERIKQTQHPKKEELLEKLIAKKHEN